MNNPSIKIYAIVLKHKSDLIQEMAVKLKATNMNFEIVDAIYGKDLDDQYYKQHGISIDPHFRNPWTNTSLTTGEMGYALSHILLEKAYEENSDYPIFVESDAIFEDKFEETVKVMLSKSPKFDLLYLGRKTFRKDKECFANK